MKKKLFAVYQVEGDNISEVFDLPTGREVEIQFIAQAGASILFDDSKGIRELIIPVFSPLVFNGIWDTMTLGCTNTGLIVGSAVATVHTIESD